jgi:hypothetical protein
MANAPLVEVRGAKKLRRTMKAAGENLADLKSVHQAAGNVVVGAARPITPRESSALVSSIRASRLAGGIAVKAGSARVPYAGPIHWGWPAHGMQARPFLTEAASASEPTWVALYEQELDKIISRIEGDN